MKVVRIDDLKGTEREVVSPAGWTSMTSTPLRPSKS